MAFFPGEFEGGLKTLTFSNIDTTKVDYINGYCDGHIVTINIGIKSGVATSSNLAKIPEEYRPKDTTRAAMVGGSTTISVRGLVIFSDDGRIVNYGGATTDAVFGSVAYMID